MKLKYLFIKNPARAAVAGYALFIMAGTLLLMLPISVEGGHISLINALFTATSAGCVTGLTVLDTGTDFTFFGQAVILLLFQAGGLGIMTLSTVLLVAAGRRPGMTSRTVVQDALNLDGTIDFRSILKDVMLFTFIIEGAGAVILLYYFLPQRSIAEAVSMSIFHSVSAFCNAGFALFPNGFICFQSAWGFNIIICLLIISGGIGFFVLSELKQKMPLTRHALSRMSLHSKIVLSATFILIITGTLLITIMEWNNTLSGLNLHEKFLAGFFQAVTARTAGFNTLNVGGMANGTLFLIIILMFVGASPGSCGGGVKTTTVACLFSLGMSRLKGIARPTLFKRSITQESIVRAASVTMVSVLVLVIGTLVMLIAETGSGGMSNRGKFIEIFFEIISAFGTVGLSTGITGTLTAIGKFIITVVMFVGRLGPLVIAMAVSRTSATRYSYAEENIMIG